MTVTLRTDATASEPALLLRPWREEDAAALFTVAQDAVLRQWTSLAVDCHQDAVNWLALELEGWESGKRLGFAVFDTRTGGAEDRLAGFVVLKNANPDPTAAEVGYWTAGHARGRGVATRALATLTTWTFATFGPGGLDRLDLFHRVDNDASCRVAEKSGYPLARLLPPTTAFPAAGHQHVRRAPRAEAEGAAETACC